jgi:hypothetical protein
VWGDRAEQGARRVVALLFVAGGICAQPGWQKRCTLRISSDRLDRACTFRNASPPHELASLESGGRIELVSAPLTEPPDMARSEFAWRLAELSDIVLDLIDHCYLTIAT